MKTRLLAITTALLLVLPAAAFAAQNHSGTITLTSPTMVGSTQLQPGDYKVEWSGNGAQVVAKFLHNNKTVATAPAKVKDEASPYGSNAVVVKTLPNHTRIVKNIYLSHAMLEFGQTS